MNTFCILVYPNKFVILKAKRDSASLPEFSVVHEVPCSREIQSVIWVHHVLFIATEDEVPILIYVTPITSSHNAVYARSNVIFFVQADIFPLQ